MYVRIQVLYNVPLESTSFMYGHITITSKGAANLCPFSLIISLELGEIYMDMYIVPHLLSHEPSVFTISTEGPRHLPALYDKLAQAQTAINTRQNYSCI